MEKNDKIHRDLARKLRKNMTLPEQQLWAALRKCQLDGYRFRHQMVLGRYRATANSARFTATKVTPLTPFTPCGGRVGDGGGSEAVTGINTHTPFLRKD